MLKDIGFGINYTDIKYIFVRAMTCKYIWERMNTICLGDHFNRQNVFSSPANI
jgi:hypothetical protein